MERAHGNGWCAGKRGRGRGVVPIAYLSSVRPMYPSRTFESLSCTTGKPPNDVSARIASTSSNFNPTLGNNTKSRIITALTGTPNECSSLLSRNGNPLNQIILPSASIPRPKQDIKPTNPTKPQMPSKKDVRWIQRMYTYQQSPPSQTNLPPSLLPLPQSS